MRNKEIRNVTTVPYQQELIDSEYYRNTMEGCKNEGVCGTDGF